MVAEKKQQDIWQSIYPKGLKWKAALEVLSVGDLFDRSASQFSEKSAVEFLGKSLSYKELASHVHRMAGALQHLGIEKGDKVGILLPNCPQFIIAYFAIVKIGAVVVNYNPLYTESELEEQVKDSKTKLIITLDISLLFGKANYLLKKTSVQHVVVGRFATYLPSVKKCLFNFMQYFSLVRDVEQYPSCLDMEKLISANYALRATKIDPKKDVAVLQYTGGTTGIPKGAMLSHANITANMQQVGLWFAGLDEGREVMLCVLPLFHAFAMTAMMNLGIFKGCQLVLHPRVNAKKILKDMRKKSVSLFMGVPALFTALLSHPKAKHRCFEHLKVCISGGAPLPGQVKADFEALSGCRVVEGYGLTETSPVATVNPIFGYEKPGSVGLPLPQTTVEIRAAKAPHKLLPVEEIGEVCIRGPQVMQGYYKQAGETKKVLKDGRLHTGDMGFLDAQGFLHIVDRLKEMIIVSGFKVYPRQVEEEIYRHPMVEEAAVIGVPHSKTGQQVKAYIKLKKDCFLDVDEMREYLAKNLTKYKQPKQIEFVDSLPKTLIGKIEKKKLRTDV